MRAIYKLIEIPMDTIDDDPSPLLFITLNSFPTDFGEVIGVDISDLSSPQIVTSWEPGEEMGEPYAITTIGSTHIAISWSWNDTGIAILEVPSLTVVGSMVFDPFDNIADMTAVGNTLYATSFNRDALIVIDISDPTSPAEVGRVTDATILDEANRLTADNDYVYVMANAIIEKINPTAQTHYGSNRLVIIDPSTPTSPSIVGQLPLTTLSEVPTTPGGLVVDGNWIFASHNQRICSIDISNKSAPTLVGVPFGFMGHSDYAGPRIDRNRKLVFKPDDLDIVDVVDVSDPSNPTFVATFDEFVPVGAADDSALLEQVFMSLDGGSFSFPDDVGRVHFANVSNPSNPILAAPYFPLNARPFRMALQPPLS